MKVAIVHELLTMKGGAERVVRIIADLFPDAPIYTLLYDEKKLGDWFPKERIRTSIVQPTTHYPLLTTHLRNHHFHLTRFPKACEAWDFSGFDLVISSSSAFVHGIITNGKPKHLCYVHSPARYLWDRTHDVQERAGKGFLGPIMHLYLSHIFHKLRIWDSEAAARPNVLLAASKEVQRRIELYWHRDSTVLTPPIDDEWLKATPSDRQAAPKKDYFLIVSTLVPYKQIDYVVEACTQANVPLVIAGDGPDKKRLQSLAGPMVTFLGHQSTTQLKSLYASARATIFPGNEDFGLVPLESMACGTPVIAWKGGGALETITEGVTGTFFEEQNAPSLLNKIVSFDHNKYSREKCIETAANHSKTKFVQGLCSHIDSLMDLGRTK